MSVCIELNYKIDKTMMMVNIKAPMQIVNKNLGTVNIVLQYA